jgi:hypothetical protein
MSGRGNDPIHIVHKRPIPPTGAIGATVALTGKINFVRNNSGRSVSCRKPQYTIKVKTWTGPECSRKLRLPDFKTLVA